MPERKLTYKDRVAATECVQLIGLLAEARTPHAKDLAKDLALVVSQRLLAIAAGSYGAVMPEAELHKWIQLAEELAGPRHASAS